MEKLSILEEAEAFRGLGAECHVQLAGAAEVRRFAAGEVVVEEGEQGNALFVVAEGEAVVYHHGAEEKEEVARLGPGEVFGEMAIVWRQARSASIVAAEDLTLFTIPREALESMLKDFPDLADSLSQLGFDRLVDNGP